MTNLSFVVFMNPGVTEHSEILVLKLAWTDPDYRLLSGLWGPQ